MYIYVLKYICIYMEQFIHTYTYKNVCIYILVCIEIFIYMYIPIQIYEKRLHVSFELPCLSSIFCKYVCKYARIF
jgi:type II secretory pathway component PulF